MQYYQIEWTNEEPDEPFKLYLELDEEGRLRRKVEAYRFGVYDAFDEPKTLTRIDPQELAGSEGHVTKLTRVQFDDFWEHSRQLPGGFMNLYY